MNEQSKPDFDHLTPDRVLHIVEETLGVRCSNICRSLNSYINRVYEVHLEDEDRAIIPKFYRPGRWDREALQDEHDFLLELDEAEVPIIPPLKNEAGDTLFESNGMYFALYNKKGGRICDEPSEDQWKELGRLLSRFHLIGAEHEPRNRITMGPKESSEEQVAFILNSGLIQGSAAKNYEAAATETLAMIEPLFEDVERIRIHGDCHHQNIIHRPDESFYLIDLDDMAVGPPIQDVWMLLPGRLQDARREMDFFIEGYETFQDFDDATLKLIEPLRAMRYIHFTAWCARQAADGGFTRLAPDWGNDGYWQQEIHELKKQQIEIQDALS